MMSTCNGKKMKQNYWSWERNPANLNFKRGIAPLVNAAHPPPPNLSPRFNISNPAQLLFQTQSASSSVYVWLFLFFAASFLFF